MAGATGGPRAAGMLSAGKKKILLLEARNRVGGRLFRQEAYGNAWIDCGAQWIESSQKNIVNYVKTLNMKFPAPDQDSEIAAITLKGMRGNLAGNHKVTPDPWCQADRPERSDSVMTSPTPTPAAPGPTTP